MKKKIQFTIKEYNLSTKQKRYITMEESQFIHILCELAGTKLTEGFHLPWLVKVVGITQDNYNDVVIDGIDYEFYIATTSQMKKNEGYYIAKNDTLLKNALKTIERIVSGNRLEKQKGKELCINKDILARFSLLFSGSYKTNIIPNFIIVKDVDYSVIRNDIKIFNRSNELVKAQGDDCILKVTAFDGCGIAGNLVFEKIKHELKMDYIPSWVTIRSSMATKGLITNVDILGYLDEFHGGTRTIIDYSGIPRTITEDSIIINESMAKWCGWFDSQENYYNSQDKKFSHLTDCLYITKVAKKEAKKVATTSYQLLTMLAITPHEYAELAKPTKDFLYKVYQGDKNAVLEFLKIISNSSVDEATDTEGKEIVVKKVDKISKLLQLDFDKYIKVPTIKRSLVTMLKRKTAELASGKFYINDSNFKVAVADPLLFLDYCVAQTKANNTIKNLNEVTGGLVPSEFYVKNEVGKRFCARFPLASYQEITNETLVKAPVYDKYCNFTNEMIVFNQRGIDAMIKSGCDFDGDILLVSNNEILMNSVVPPADGLLFINKEDGKSVPMVYTDENRVYCNLKVLGDKIGQLAITSSTIGDTAQEYGYFKPDGTFVTNKEVKDLNLDTKTLKSIWTLTEAERKQHYIDRFHSIDKKLCEGIVLQMKAIDSPKTLEAVTEEQMNNFIKGYEAKPSFFPLLPDKNYHWKGCKDTHSVISGYAYEMTKAPNNIERKYHGLHAKVMRYSNLCINDDTQIMADTFATALLLSADEGRALEVSNMIQRNYNKFQKENTNRKQTISKTGSFGEKLLDYEFKYSSEERLLMYKASCLAQEIYAKEIFDNYSQEEIAKGIQIFLSKNVKDVNRYIIDFYWSSLEFILSLQYKTASQLIEDSEGKIRLFDSYKVIAVAIENSNYFDGKISKIESNKLTRKLEIESIKCKLVDGVTELPPIVNLELSKNGLIVNHLSGQKLGTVYKDHIYKELLNKNVELKSYYIGARSTTLVIDEIL